MLVIIKYDFPEAGGAGGGEIYVFIQEDFAYHSRET